MDSTVTGDPVTLDSIRHLDVVDVPTAGAVLGLGRESAYRAARAGTLPTIKLSERRVVVPVARLVQMLEGDAPSAA
jgi:hypothetical protein